jgi:hypothetical protein
MVRPIRLVVLAALTLAAGAARAQYVGTPYGGAPQPAPQYASPQGETWDTAPQGRHLVRLTIGSGGMSTGYYCTYWSYGYCYSWYNLTYVPLSLGASADFGLSPGFALSPGFQWLSTPWHDRKINVYDFTLDARFASRPRRGVKPRASLGFDVPVNDRGDVGFGGRLGFGASYGTGKTTFGIDIYFGYAGLNGFEVGTLMVLVGPEFHL